MRRVTESAFWIWTSRFRLFSSREILTPEKVEIITMESLAPHDLLRTKSSERNSLSFMLDQEDEHGNFTPGEWRNGCPANLADLQTAEQEGPLPTQQLRNVGF